MPAPKIAPELLERALTGERTALRALLEQLAPIIQARVIRILARRSGGGARDARQEMLDMTQEVFLSLIESNGRALRAWREERGLSLENFVGFLAERQVLSILRTGRRNPWKEDQTAVDELEHHLGSDETGWPATQSREMLRMLLDRLREELSPKMLEIFFAVWVDETPMPELCERLGMQTDAVYAARSRIGKRARAIAAELEREVSDSERAARSPSGGQDE